MKEFKVEPAPIIRYEISKKAKSIMDNNAKNYYLHLNDQYMIVIGRTGSGKTSFVTSFLKFYKQYDFYDNTIVYSYSTKNNDMWKKIDNKIDVRNYFDFDEFFEFCDVIEKQLTQRRKEKKPKIQYLVVFDDMLNEILSNANHEFTKKIITRTSHIGISFIFVTQNYKSINHIIRANSAYLIIYALPSSEIKKIAEENAIFNNTKYQELIMTDIISPEYSFLIIDKQSKPTMYKLQGKKYEIVHESLPEPSEDILQQ